MPLKHHTETWLIVLLACVMAVTGVLLAWIPPFPEGALAWVLLLVATSAYPLLLAPFLKRNRAEYEFRRLHLFPLGMTLLWGIARGLAYVLSGWDAAAAFLTIFWSAPLVLLGIALLAWFSVAVVRRSGVRLSFLSAIAGAFLTLAIFAYLLDWNAAIGERLFADTFLTRNPLTALFPSDLTSESGSIIGRHDSSSSTSLSSVGSSSSGSFGEDVDTPPKLVKSGGEVALLAILFLGLYCGALHRRVSVRA